MGTNVFQPLRAEESIEKRFIWVKVLNRRKGDDVLHDIEWQTAGWLAHKAGFGEGGPLLPQDTLPTHITLPGERSVFHQIGLWTDGSWWFPFTNNSQTLVSMLWIEKQKREISPYRANLRNVGGNVFIKVGAADIIQEIVHLALTGHKGGAYEGGFWLRAKTKHHADMGIH